MILADIVTKQYGGQAAIQGALDETGGALPFTGLDLFLVCWMGIVLLVFGLLLRRVSRS